jgi:oligopeptide transport system ATP-binding protein
MSSHIERKPLLQVHNLSTDFPIKSESLWDQFFNRKSRMLHAVQDVSFDLYPGETLGIVGESGCGKSTLARSILRLVSPTSGTVKAFGHNWLTLSELELRHHRRLIQMIFQDPLASLNPRRTIGEIIAEPLQIHFPHLSALDIQDRVHKMIQQVGLSPHHLYRYPHEFSGGQCQRVGIARAMILNPKILICDEPVSALDVSIQGQIINLLKDLQKTHGISIIFISHNLSIVRYVSHRVMVMYLGKIVETGTRDTLFQNPKHPYTQALIGSSLPPIPSEEEGAGPSSPSLKEDFPSLLNPPSGCPFHTRCLYQTSLCQETMPPLEELDSDTSVACHHWRSLKKA